MNQWDLEDNWSVHSANRLSWQGSELSGCLEGSTRSKWTLQGPDKYFLIVRVVLQWIWEALKIVSTPLSEGLNKA